VGGLEECADLERASVVVGDGDDSVVAEASASSVREPAGWERSDTCIVDFALELPHRTLYRFELAGIESDTFTLEELRESAFHIELTEFG
jgi:hypothetical protein